jgi:hypothetical protein
MVAQAQEICRTQAGRDLELVTYCLAEMDEATKLAADRRR